MSELKKMSMSELIARYNALAALKGVSPVTEFKNLAAARAAVTELEEGKTMTDATNTQDAAVATSDTDKTKYTSTGKRGPNQGVGEFAKKLIVEGKTNQEILAAIKEQMPGAKTTNSCIAYYRAALKNPLLGKRGGKTPEQLRAEAQAAIAKAEALEKAAAEKAAAQAAATAAPAEAQPA